MFCVEKYDKRACFAVGATVVYISASGILFWYLLVNLGEPADTRSSAKYTEIRKCLQKLGCNGSTKCPKEHIELCAGLDTYRGDHSKVVDKWVANGLCQSRLQQITAKVVKEKYDGIVQGLSSSESDFFSDAEWAITHVPRFMVHWFPRKGGLEGAISKWEKVSDWETHYATYTVTSGPPGTLNDSSILASENGLHYVYAKLTFACKAGDNQTKSMSIRVVVEESPESEPLVILKKSERARCILQGDVATLHQSGHFRLAAGNKVYMEFEASPGVVTSESRSRVYSSYIGLHRVY